MRKKRLTAFQLWIEKYGLEALALKLGLNKNTVRNWHHGTRIPEPTTMKRIKKISRGKVSYEQMIDGAG